MMATRETRDVYCSDAELLSYIQHIVEEWFRTTYRLPFTEMLRAKHPESCPWPCFILDSAQRRMYPMLAAMIRFGEAHSTFNRQPLLTALAIARRPIDANEDPAQKVSFETEPESTTPA